MKQKFKRFLAGFMAMLTIFTTFATSGTTAFAASPQANMKIWFASPRATGEISELKAGYEHGRMFYHWIDTACIKHLRASIRQMFMRLSGDIAETNYLQLRILNSAMEAKIPKAVVLSFFYPDKSPSEMEMVCRQYIEEH